MKIVQPCQTNELVTNLKVILYGNMFSTLPILILNDMRGYQNMNFVNVSGWATIFILFNTLPILILNGIRGYLNMNFIYVSGWATMWVRSETRASFQVSGSQNFASRYLLPRHPPSRSHLSMSSFRHEHSILPMLRKRLCSLQGGHCAACVHIPLCSSLACCKEELCSLFLQADPYLSCSLRQTRFSHAS